MLTCLNSADQLHLVKTPAQATALLDLQPCSLTRYDAQAAFGLQRGRESASATSSGSWNTDPADVPPNITEELQGLAAKGLTAPLDRKSHPKQVKSLCVPDLSIDSKHTSSLKQVGPLA